MFFNRSRSTTNENAQMSRYCIIIYTLKLNKLFIWPPFVQIIPGDRMVFGGGGGDVLGGKGISCSLIEFIDSFTTDTSS